MLEESTSPVCPWVFDKEREAAVQSLVLTLGLNMPLEVCPPSLWGLDGIRLKMCLLARGLIPVVVWFFVFLFFVFFCFLGPYPQHMEVPRLGVDLELQLLAYTTATAMPDPSCICNLP